MSERSNDRPKTIPEMRGMSMSVDARERERNRERPYSAESYAAQYGITVEDAAEIRERSTNHQQIVRQITAMFTNNSELKRRALMLESGAETKPLSKEEEERYRRLLKDGVPTKGMDE